MTIIDYIPVRVRPAPGLAAAPSPSELDEAEQLVADLAALVDAGLVSVRRQLGGPARYGAIVDLDGAA
ncbi:MAG TPA: hypothetical protein VG371_02405 [Solirubrobacteraceae bacterium]|jgi:hypothetical protein|nr:hypothetical protein [Solirubrobacteraceae bacterium]